MKELIYCNVCKAELKGKQTMFCSLQCKNKVHQSYKAQKHRGLMRKLQLFKMAGGQCTKCGYKKNLSGLSFHHTESIEKDFKLDMRSLSNRKMSKVIQEFGKCILLCQNCHSELHNPELDLDSESLSRLL